MPSSLTQRDFQLLEMEPVSRKLPIVFKNKAEFAKMEGHCLSCQEIIKDDLFRGLVTQQSESIVSVEAAGICNECKLLTRFILRLGDDMSITTLKNNRWVTFRPKRTLLERFKRYIKSISQQKDI